MKHTHGLLHASVVAALLAGSVVPAAMAEDRSACLRRCHDQLHRCLDRVRTVPMQERDYWREQCRGERSKCGTACREGK